MNDNWNSFVQRLSGVGKDKLRNNRDGVCVCVVRMIMDAEGNPVVWSEPTVQRIEPSSIAAAVLVGLTDS